MPRAKTATATPAATPKRVSGPVTERKRTPRTTKTVPAAMTAIQFDASAHYDEIAHAAYLNYLQRGGGDGSQESDWLAAEAQVRAKYVS